MIPGVTAQAPGKRFRAHQVISIRSLSAVNTSRNKGYLKSITVAWPESLSVNRSYARGKLIVVGVGEAISTVRKKAKVFSVSLLQAITVKTRIPKKFIYIFQYQAISFPVSTPSATRFRGSGEYDGTVFFENEDKIAPFFGNGTAQSNPAGETAPS